MAKIYQIAFELAGKLGSNFASTFLSAQKTINNMDGQIKKVTSNQAKITRFDSLKRELIDTEKQFQEAQNKVKGLADAMKAAEQPTKAMEKAFAKAKDEAGKLKDKLGEQQKTLSHAREDMQKAGISVDKLAAEHRKLASEMSKLEKSKKVYTDLQSHITKFKSSSVSAFKSISVAAGACTAAVAGYAATAMSFANKAMDAAAHARAGAKLGFGVEAYQELSYAAKMSGVAVEDFDGCMKKMVVNLAKAQKGTDGEDGKGGLSGQLKAIGLSVHELNGMAPDQALMKVTQALSSVQDPAERTRIAVAMFGKEGMNMVPMLKQGQEGIQKFRDEAKSMGLVLDEQTVKQAAAYGKVKKQFNAVMDGAKLTIGSALLPVLTTGAEQVMAMLKANQGDIQAFAAQFASGIKAAIPYAIDFIKGAKDIASTVITVTKAVAYSVGGFRNLAYILGGLAAIKTALAFYSMGKNMVSMGKDAIQLIGILRRVSIAQAALNVVMSMSTIGLVVAGIAALVAIGYVLYSNWSTIKAFFSKLWDSPAFALVAFITGPIGWIIAAGVGIIANWDAVKQWFVTLWNDPSAAVDQFIAMIKSKFSLLANWVQEKWASIKSIFSGGGGGAVSAQVSMPGHADGGIFGKEHIARFAEGNKPEAIIPLTNRARGLAVMAQAQRFLGIPAPSLRLLPAQGSQGGKITISANMPQGKSGGNTFVYSPRFYMGNASAKEMEPILKEDKRDFERQMSTYTAQQRRVSYDS